MDAYHVALFVHIVTLMVAGGATAITKLAAERRARARTIGEALDWHSTLVSGSKVFPACLVSFVVTGGYMLSATQTAAWSSGFVVAGLAGVVLLLLSGTFLGTKARGLTPVLEGIAEKGRELPAPKLVPPPMIAMLPLVNTALALSVTFDMVVKPPEVGVALGILGAGVVLGAAIAARRRTAPAASEATPA